MRTVCFTTFSMPVVSIESSGNTHQNENMFLTFESLTYNAEVENVII